MPEHREFPRGDAFDIACYVGTVEDAADRVVDRALSRAGGYAVLCNVHVMTTARRDPAVRAALGNAWAVFPDGAPVAWLMRRSGARSARRIGGPDLMEAVLDRGRRQELRHFFFGSTPAVLGALVQELCARFPGIAVAGSVAPPPGAENNADSLLAITRADADIVWVALGAPKQEQWMQRHAGALGSGLALGVGAAFDFHAGAKSRAPGWMQRAGLEWLHRFVSEPRRLAVRYVTSNSRFVVDAAVELIRRRLR